MIRRGGAPACSVGARWRLSRGRVARTSSHAGDHGHRRGLRDRRAVRLRYSTVPRVRPPSSCRRHPAVVLPTLHRLCVAAVRRRPDAAAAHVGAAVRRRSAGTSSTTPSRRRRRASSGWLIPGIMFELMAFPAVALVDRRPIVACREPHRAVRIRLRAVVARLRRRLLGAWLGWWLGSWSPLPRLELTPCGCGSTSPTTARSSTGGRRSRRCAPSRARSRRLSPPS